MKSSKAIFSTLLGIELALIGGNAAAQTVLPQSRTLQRGEFGVQALMPKASAFLASAGLPAYDFRKAKAVLYEGIPSWRLWQIYAGPYYFEFNPSTGDLFQYRNEQRRKDQYLGRGRTGRVAFKTAKERKQYLVRTAIAFGMPTTSRIVRLDSADDGTVQDANRTGYFGIVMSDDKTRWACMMSCDIQDGLVTYFLMWHQRTGPYRPPVYKRSPP